MTETNTAGGNHNHSSCVRNALTSAHNLCGAEGVRLTTLRRQVLKIVWGGHGAVKAYEIIDRLSTPHRLAKPPTVYRTLRFLLQRGLVHRLESLNAFVGCPDPDGRHESQFLICNGCGWVREMRTAHISKAIERNARSAGFAVEHKTIEVFGTCNSCLREGEGR